MKSILPISLIIIVCALIVSFAIRPFTRKFVENALEGQTREVMLSAGIASVDEVVYNHHFLKMPANADFETQTKIAKLIDSDVPGAYVPEPKPPAEVSLTRINNGMLLVAGNVPTSIIKDRCIDIAKVETTQIDNQIAVVKNIVDPEWNESVYQFAETFLNTKGSQHISIRENSITLRGEVMSPTIADQLKSMALSAMSSDTVLVDELTIRPPSNRVLPFALVKSGANNFVLKGNAPDAASKDHFFRVVKENVKDQMVTIDNQLTVNPTVYPNGTLPEAVGIFVGHSSTISGITHLIASPRNFTLRGEVSEVDIKTAIGELATAAVGNKLKVDNLLTITPVPEPVVEIVQAAPVVVVEEKVTATFKDNVVYFATNSSELTDKANEQVDQIAEAIKTSELQPKLVVGGYADNRGNAEFNKQLSLKRANAVRSRLVSLGIPESQMTLQHFGEDASNYAADELWKSRRVELSFETNQ